MDSTKLYFNTDYAESIRRSKNIVAVRKRGSKPPDPVSAKAVSRVAVLMALNRRLLRRLFWEYFPDRVQGLSGIPANEKITAGKLRTLIERLKN